METRSWREFALHMGEVYGVKLVLDDPDEDDNVVYCCECGEPIYEYDYPEIQFDGENYLCPICEIEM